LVYALLAAEPLTDDTIHHYLTSKWLHKHAYLIVSTWGRPAVSLVYAPASHLGFFWCRMTSLAICLAACLYTFRLARETGLKYAWLAVPLVFFQTQFFRLSTDLLTEPLFALIIICAVRNFVRGKYNWAALQFSVSMAARPAGFFVAALFGIIMAVFALRGKLGHPKAAVMKLLPAGVLLASIPAIWNVAGAIIYGGGMRSSIHETAAGFLNGTYDLLWLSHSNAWDTVMFKYGSDGPLHYLILMPLVTGGCIMMLMIPGYLTLFKMRGVWIIPAVWTSFFVLHTFLRTSGLYASGGYARFFVSVAPLAGIMAVAGAARFATNLKWVPLTFLACVAFYVYLVPWITTFPFFKETYLLDSGNIVKIVWDKFLWIVVPATVVIPACWVFLSKRYGRQPGIRSSAKHVSAPIFAVICLVLPIVECITAVAPARQNATYQLIRDLGEWLRRERPELTEDLGSFRPRKTDAKLIFARYSLHMGKGWDPYDNSRFGTFSKEEIASLPKGSIIVWDSGFSKTEYRVTEKALDDNDRLESLTKFETRLGREQKFTLHVYEVVKQSPQKDG